jgi:hypothetical protein
MVYQTTRFHVFKRDNFRCQYCGRSSDEVTLEIDHLVPVSKGGTNDFDNLITACRECNKQKSNHDIVENCYADKPVTKEVFNKNNNTELSNRKIRVDLTIDPCLKTAFYKAVPIHGKTLSSLLEEEIRKLLENQDPEVLLIKHIAKVERELAELKTIKH